MANDGVHVPDEHDALHDRARTFLENAVRRCTHGRIPGDIVMRELIDMLAQVSVENETPLSEVVAELIESYQDSLVAATPIVEVHLEPKVPTDAN